MDSNLLLCPCCDNDSLDDSGYCYECGYDENDEIEYHESFDPEYWK